MALLQRILTSLTLLLISTMIQALEFKNYTKNWSSEAEYVFYTGNDFDTPDNSILYASCKIERCVDNFHCSIIVDSPTDIEICDSEFRNSEFETRNRSLYIMDLRRISGNKIFITYLLEISGQYSYIVRVSVLNRSDCSMADIVEYTLKPKVDTFILPVIYNNTFDIFLSNNPLCGRFYACKISYDQTGKQTKLTAFLMDIKMASVIPFALASPLKGIFVTIYDNIPTLRVKYLTPEAFKILIRESVEHHDFWNSRISSAHEISSICYRNQKLKSYCIQFDSDGERLANISIKLEKNEILRGSYNVGKGQMLVFTEPYGQNWTVRKITAQIQEKPLDLDFTCAAQLLWHDGVLTKETNDQFIFYLTCLDDSYDNKLNYMKYSVKYVSKKFMLNIP